MDYLNLAIWILIAVEETTLDHAEYKAASSLLDALVERQRDQDIERICDSI